MREDADLKVLALASHEDLSRLAQFLTHDPLDGMARFTSALDRDKEFLAAQMAGDLKPAWKTIASELQTYGGNSVVNVVRGYNHPTSFIGVSYREIMQDIVSKLSVPKIKFDDRPIHEIEEDVLKELLAYSLHPREIEALKAIRDGLAQTTDEKDSWFYFLAKIEWDRKPKSELEKKGIMSAKGLAAVGAVGAAIFAGMPVAAAVVASGVSKLSGPAFRVTVPAVLEVIRIRRAVLRSMGKLGAIQ